MAAMARARGFASILKEGRRPALCMFMLVNVAHGSITLATAVLGPAPGPADGKQWRDAQQSSRGLRSHRDRPTPTMEDFTDDCSLEQGFLEEAGEITALVSDVLQSEGKAARRVYDRFKQIVSALAVLYHHTIPSMPVEPKWCW